MRQMRRWMGWALALSMVMTTDVAFAEDDEDLARLADGVVRFVSGSSQMTPESERIMDRVAKTLERRSAERLLIVGHTDRHGSAALNRTLSRKRAEVVKAALAKRGIPKERMTTIGAGYSEPLDAAKSADADDLNRRVELWVGVRNPLAWVSWIYEKVEAKRPKSIWDRAEIRMALDKLFQVRTTGRSAGEVTFVSGHRMYLGPDALAVIYGEGHVKKTNRARTFDVRLEEGAIFTRLRAKEDKPLIVETEASKMTITSRKGTRVEHSAKKKRSTVSVYDGKATVAAKGQSVDVDGGYGTRVKNGEAPEPATPLIPGPAWSTDAPIFQWSGVPVDLAWTPVSGAGESVLEVSDHSDTDMERPKRVEILDGRTMKLEMPAGAYRIRVTSFDEREILGLPSKSRTVVLVKAPTDDSGQALASGGGIVPIGGRTSVSLSKLDGFNVVWKKNGERVAADKISVVGGDTLSMEILDKNARRIALREWSFRLAAIAIQLDRIDGPQVVKGVVETSVEVTVTTLDGTPIEEPRPLVFVRTDGMLEGAPVLDAEGQKSKVETYVDPPYALEISTAAVDVGRYRITRRHPVDLNVVDESLAFVFPTARAAGIVKLPKWVRPAADIPQLRTGLYLGAMGGVQFRNNPSVSPWLSVEAGLAALSFDQLRVTLGVQGAFMPTELYNGSTKVADLTVIPIYGRVTVAWVLGWFRPYAGLAVGVRIVDVSGVTPESIGLERVQLGMNGLVGIGLGGKNFEVFVEASYGKLDLRNLNFKETTGDLTVVGGFRYFFY